MSPHAALHAFDAVIILTTFVLEVALRGRERELAALLVILRLWRLVKLVGGKYSATDAEPEHIYPTGVAVGAGELEEETARSLVETKIELERVQGELNDTRKENTLLKQRIMHGSYGGELDA